MQIWLHWFVDICIIGPLAPIRQLLGLWYFLWNVYFNVGRACVSGFTQDGSGNPHANTIAQNNWVRRRGIDKRTKHTYIYIYISRSLLRDGLPGGSPYGEWTETTASSSFDSTHIGLSVRSSELSDRLGSIAILSQCAIEGGIPSGLLGCLKLLKAKWLQEWLDCAG